MNRHGAIELTWADGDYTFRLPLERIDELETKTEMSVFVLYASMASKIPLARAKHYSETIRLGLIGGGMDPVKALTLVRRYVEERPLHESVAVAEAILRAAIERVHSPGLGDEPSGEAEAPKSPGSTSAPSTETPS